MPDSVREPAGPVSGRGDPQALASQAAGAVSQALGHGGQLQGRGGVGGRLAVLGHGGRQTGVGALAQTDVQRQLGQQRHLVAEGLAQGGADDLAPAGAADLQA